jgi:WD40 repeat protein
VWRVEDGKLLRTLVGQKYIAVKSVAFSPDGRLLASAAASAAAGPALGEKTVRLLLWGIS